MNGHLDRVGLVRAFLEHKTPGNERRMLAACLAIADDQGHVELDLARLAPLSGNRYQYAGQALECLIRDGWLVVLGDGKGKLTVKEIDKDLDDSFPGNL